MSLAPFLPHFVFLPTPSWSSQLLLNFGAYFPLTSYLTPFLPTVLYLFL